MSAAPSSFATSLDRRIQMLRTAKGPLTAAALEDERAQWQAVGIPFEMIRRKKAVAEPALSAPAADQPMPPAA